MQPVTDIPMAELDILSKEFGQDPFSRFAEARKRSWLAKSQVGYVVLDYQGMKDLLYMDDKFRTPNREVTQLMQAENTRWGKWNNTFLLAQRGDAHKRIRDIVAPTFTPQNANRHRHIMREVIINHLNDWAPKGRFDFTEFASFFPITVMCRLIGAPTSAVPRIKDALEVMGTGFNLDPSLLPALDSAFVLLHDFVADLLAERRRTGPASADNTDLLDTLLAAHAEGSRLSDEELLHLLVLLFGAGYDTSKNLLGVIMHIMLDRPGDWSRMAREPEFAKKVLEETLRFTNVVTTYRVANEDIVYRDVLFPKETMLVFPIPFSGKDETVFEHGATFDPERTQDKRHFAFGRGIHICLGQFIARAQIEEALPIISARLRDPRREGPPEWRTFPGIWGLARLPIAFDPAAPS